MTFATTYLKPNITIETELIGVRKFYVYNYQGINYRVFCSLINLQNFIKKGQATWSFECCVESDLEEYFKKVL